MAKKPKEVDPDILGVNTDIDPNIIKDNGR